MEKYAITFILPKKIVAFRKCFVNQKKYSSNLLLEKVKMNCLKKIFYSLFERVLIKRLLSKKVLNLIFTKKISYIQIPSIL